MLRSWRGSDRARRGTREGERMKMKIMEKAKVNLTRKEPFHTPAPAAFPRNLFTACDDSAAAATARRGGQARPASPSWPGLRHRGATPCRDVRHGSDKDRLRYTCTVRTKRVSSPARRGWKTKTGRRARTADDGAGSLPRTNLSSSTGSRASAPRRARWARRTGFLASVRVHTWNQNGKKSRVSNE